MTDHQRAMEKLVIWAVIFYLKLFNNKVFRCITFRQKDCFCKYRFFSIIDSINEKLIPKSDYSTFSFVRSIDYRAPYTHPRESYLWQDRWTMVWSWWSWYQGDAIKKRCVEGVGIRCNIMVLFILCYYNIVYYCSKLQVTIQWNEARVMINVTWNMTKQVQVMVGS